MRFCGRLAPVRWISASTRNISGLPASQRTPGSWAAGERGLLGASNAPRLSEDESKAVARIREQLQALRDDDESVALAATTILLAKAKDESNIKSLLQGFYQTSKQQGAFETVVNLLETHGFRE